MCRLQIFFADGIMREVNDDIIYYNRDAERAFFPPHLQQRQSFLPYHENSLLYFRLTKERIETHPTTFLAAFILQRIDDPFIYTSEVIQI